MTPLEKRLAAKLLKMCSERFSNHGCNDYDLVKEGGFTPEESFELRKSLTAAGDYPDDEVPPNRHWIMDWLGMALMAKKLEEEIGSSQTS